MQNLVLVVQNTLDVRRDRRRAARRVTFFRSLGGTIGVSVMGAVLGTKVTSLITDGLMKLGVDPSKTGLGGGTLPELSLLPAPVRTLVENAYGQGVGEIFLIASPLALVTLVAVIFLPNIALGSKTGVQQLVEKEGEILVDVASGSVAVTPNVDSIEAPARAAGSDGAPASSGR